MNKNYQKPMANVHEFEISDSLMSLLSEGGYSPLPGDDEGYTL